jgi:hypothetical protein
LTFQGLTQDHHHLTDRPDPLDPLNLLLCLCCDDHFTHTCISPTHPQVEIKTTAHTTNPDVLQKAADFVHAFILGELW